MRIKILSIALVFLALLVPTGARADGIIIPEPPVCDPCPPPPCPPELPCPPLPPTPMVQLAIRYHHVQVSIQDQLVVTHVDQVFYNPNDWQVEGEYIFPLPAEAAVNSFTLWVEGKPVKGEILEAKQARQKYWEIVNSLRDPALLEYLDRGAVQAHVFPIPPRGERRVELEYTQALAAENGLVRYVYPLNTEKFSLWPLESVSVSVDVRASLPIRAVYSPSHSVDIARDGMNHVSVGYEDRQVKPDSDFVLYYSLGESEAFHLLTYRYPAGIEENGFEEDGFFVLLLAPRPQAAEQPVAKDILLVLDRSGSMEGEKFDQAQQALTFILDHLNTEDRFNIIAFSTGVESYASSMQPALRAADGRRWVQSLSASGSTDINRALLDAAALADRERTTYLVFLTDGLPTVGEVDGQRILDNLEPALPKNVRLFSFGVGYDVDTILLDSLAQNHHGLSAYVRPEEALDEVLSGFYERISTPVLTDVELDFGELSVYDLYPSPLPDLFSGSQVIVAGRYRGGGVVDVALTGSVEGERRVYHFDRQVFPAAGQPAPSAGLNEAIPRLWATRKIGSLLNRLRLEGADQETIDQIVRLSIRFGIVTPYTSYLVTELSPLGAAEQERIAQEQYQQLQAQPTQPAFGMGAVEKAAEQGALAGAQAPAPPVEQAASQVKIVGPRTFVYTDEKWVDTAFDPEQMATLKVSFLSSDYQALLEKRPDLAAPFALGERVIVVSGGQAYEVVPAGEAASPLDLSQASLNPETEPTETLSSPPPATAGDQPEETETPAAAPGAGFPCASGLLPLVLLPPFALATRRMFFGR